MLTANIKIDGKGYYGEDLEETYPADVGGEGWHVANHGALHMLKLADGPGKDIEGKRNLQSEIDRIMRRISDGKLEASKIEITLKNA